MSVRAPDTVRTPPPPSCREAEAEAPLARIVPLPPPRSRRPERTTDPPASGTGALDSRQIFEGSRFSGPAPSRSRGPAAAPPSVRSAAPPSVSPEARMSGIVSSRPSRAADAAADFTSDLLSQPPPSRLPPSRGSVGPPSSRGSGPPPSRRASVPPPAALAFAAATLVPACAAPTRSDAPPPIEGQPVSIAQLDVTAGSIVARDAPTSLTTSSAVVRAVAPHTTGDGAELRFTYRGHTDERSRLANGEERTQVGLKLRAEDTCNLLYVMWRLDGEQRIAVSVKRNPGQHTHEDCGAEGYIGIAPSYSAPLPRLVAGESHRITAAIEDGRLLVLVDGNAVWEGSLPETALSLQGQIGVRADNAKLDMELVPIRTLGPAFPAPVHNDVVPERPAARSTILPALAGTIPRSGAPPPRR